MSDGTEQDHLLDHNYDGIQEYDNPLPTWWTTLFWVTIVFSVLYATHYHFGKGKLDIAAYNEDMIAFYELQAEQLLALGPIGEGTLSSLMDDDTMMAGGGQIFDQGYGDLPVGPDGNVRRQIGVAPYENLKIVIGTDPVTRLIVGSIPDHHGGRQPVETLTARE